MRTPLPSRHSAPFIDLHNHVVPGVDDGCFSLLEEGLVHLLVSDHHGANRPHILHSEVFTRIVERGDAPEAELLLADNPRRVPQDRPPRAVAAIRAPIKAQA